MDAREFYRSFVEHTCENTIWSGEQGKGRTYLQVYMTDQVAYTELVNKLIIHGILRRGGYKVQHEYFRVDTIGWQDAGRNSGDDTHSYGLNRHFWDLLAAVEHENDEADWADELIKLAHLRCPLKVVVGYNYCDCRQEDMARLRLAAGWLKGIRAYDPSSREEYLVILGNCRAKDLHNPGYSSFDYRGYVYNYESESFERV